MSCHRLVVSTSEIYHLARRAYVGPCYEIVGSFSKSLHNRVFHDFVWDIEAVCVFDESPAWFASTRISADRDVGIEVRDDPLPSILRLDCDSLEEKIHRRHETLQSTGTTVSYQTFPVAMRYHSQFAVQGERNDRQATYSRVRAETRVSLS